MEVVAKANLYKDENLKRSAEFLQDFWDKLPFITREKQEYLKSATIIQYTIKGRFMSR